jgi:BirA family biotin operon repressor/biotin-[acetyl-CoA-carboxylase] ligase
MSNGLRRGKRGDFDSADAIRQGLGTRFIGQTVYYWPSIGSTNEELKRLADLGAPEGTLAIADQQTAGRGRLDRHWIAPPASSLLMSLLFRPVFLPAARAQQLTMICALAAADAVAEVTGLQPALKWPNDLLWGEKKLAGVLTELAFGGQDGPADASHSPSVSLAWGVVGVGLNVNVDFAQPALRAEWPELADLATSLATALERPVARLPLLQSYLRGVEARYEKLRSGHSPHSEWAARLATVGRQVRVYTPDGAYDGVAEGVDETGVLVLRRPDGSTQRILTGDVSLQAMQ